MPRREPCGRAGPEDKLSWRGLPGVQTFFTHTLSSPFFALHTQVAKQDKKKTPKGRAKKRLQYNRRFVNVVTGPGKKRGPNSNPTQ